MASGGNGRGGSLWRAILIPTRLVNQYPVVDTRYFRLSLIEFVLFLFWKDSIVLFLSFLL